MRSRMQPDRPGGPEMGRWAVGLWLGVAVGVVGCASTPEPDPDYSQIAADIQFSSASLESGEPATLPREPELGGPHPVDFYVQIALERNPEILARQRGVAAQSEVIPQVTALEDPMLSDTFWPITEHSPQTASGRMPNAFMISQQFPWIGKLRLRGEIAEQETKMAISRLVQTELKVVEDAHLAYYEIYFDQKAIEITERDRELLTALLQIAEVRYRTGATSQQDVLRAQVELDRLDDRLIVLRRQLRMAQADLAKILHTSPEAELSAESDLRELSAPEEIDLLYEAAVRCRPELQERLAAIIRDQRAENLAMLQYFPDVSLGVGWDAMTTSDALSAVADGKDNLGFTIGLNLPIWQDKLQAGVRETQHRAAQSARLYDAERDETFRLIRRLMVEARSLEQQIALFRDSILPKADQTLRVSMADYRVGKVDFLQLIDNWSQLLAFQVQLVRFEASLRQRLASLERVVGCQLASLPETRAEAIEADGPEEASTSGRPHAAMAKAKLLPIRDEP